MEPSVSCCCKDHGELVTEVGEMNGEKKGIGMKMLNIAFQMKAAFVSNHKYLTKKSIVS